MKRTLILTAILLVAASTAVFADTKNTVTPKTSVQSNRPDFERPRPPMQGFQGQRPPKGPDFEKRNAEFEKRLNLTEEQKKKAEEMRREGFEKMKPVMEKMKEKQKEERFLREQNPESPKLQELRKEIDVLKKEAHKMRQENMKEFESLLDKNQLKELNIMKEEGRKKFEEMNKQRQINKIPPKNI